MTDLHTHTLNSDGTDTTARLLANAEKAGIKCLSITDHDTVSAYDDLKSININDYYTGRLLSGCELFSMVDGTTIELLGYNIDTDIMKEELKTLVKYTIPEMDRYEAEELLKLSKQEGFIMNMPVLEEELRKDYRTRTWHKEIRKYEENKKFFSENERAWENMQVFYRECICNPSSMFFINRDHMMPKPGEVIDVIRKAGGLVFIPHIYVYGEHSEKILKKLVDNYDIDGIECYYPTFTDEQTEYLVDFCKQRNLYVSGGSDYHGKTVKANELAKRNDGKDIPGDIVNDWIGLTRNINI